MKKYLTIVLIIITSIISLSFEKNNNDLYLNNKYVTAIIHGIESENPGFIKAFYLNDSEYNMISNHTMNIMNNNLNIHKIDKHLDKIIVYFSSDNLKISNTYFLKENNIFIETNIQNISNSQQMIRLNEIYDFNDRFPDFVGTRIEDHLAFIMQDKTFALGYFEKNYGDIFRLITNNYRMISSPVFKTLQPEESYSFSRYFKIESNVNDLQKYLLNKYNIEYKEYSGKIELSNSKIPKNMKVNLVDFTGQREYSITYTDEEGNFNFYMPEAEYFFKVNFGNIKTQRTQENHIFIDVEENYFFYEPFLTNRTYEGITVNFRTNIPANSKIYVYDRNLNRKEFSTISPSDYHHIRIEGLDSGENYLYIIHVEDNFSNHIISEIRSFTTKNEKYENLSFIVYSDSQIHDKRHSYVVERINKHYNPDFVIRAGDLVEHGHDENQWREHFRSTKPLIGNIPIYPALGNHEYNHILYYKAFDLPLGGGDFYKRWYSFNYDENLFIILDSNVVKSSPLFNEQINWLKNTLYQNSEKKNIFVAYHHPFWTSSAEYGSMDENTPEGHYNTQFWKPIFEEFNVTAVFNGHIHLYERYFKNGIHYITYGGGGGRLNLNPPVEPLSWREEFIMGYLGFIYVEIEGEKITLKAHAVAKDSDPRFPLEFISVDKIIDYFNIK